MERCYFWEFILFICWNEENFDMVMWIFQMKLERCKNLKVFFCGTVPLFAHFILCYRGISLTVFDYFVCLGLLVKVLLCCSWKLYDEKRSLDFSDVPDFQLLNVLPSQFLVVDRSLPPSGTRFIRTLIGVLSLPLISLLLPLYITLFIICLVPGAGW